jgi:hypothetical protein
MDAGVQDLTRVIERGCFFDYIFNPTTRLEVTVTLNNFEDVLSGLLSARE